MRPITIEKRDNGSLNLIGQWPDRALVTPEAMDIFGVASIKIGEDFPIRLDNAQARYRYVDTMPNGDLVCERITFVHPVG
jgi:hypothetical protein